MITDKNLWLMKRTDAAATTTRAVPLGQDDLTRCSAETDGMGPYCGLWLNVVTPADVPAGATIILQHSDEETGTFETVFTHATTAAIKANSWLAKIPLPFGVKNWIRVSFGTAAQYDVFLNMGPDKGVVVND